MPLLTRSSSFAGRRRGFTLLELSISLLVLSLLLAGALTMATDIVARKNVKTDKEKIAVIQEALENYAARYGKLPCPASRTTTLGASTFGRAVLGDCVTDTSEPAGTERVENNSRYTRIGAVPVRDMLLRDEYMHDSFGGRFTYGVAENLTSTSTYTNAGGTMTVNDGAGVDITTKAAYVVVTHGKDGKGAYGFDSGALKVDCGATTNLDVENCDDDTVFSRAVYNDGIVEAKYFDDTTLAYDTKIGVAMCFRVDGASAGDYLGGYNTTPVGATGDFNGDGYADLLTMGVNQPAGSSQRNAYVIFGDDQGIPLPLPIGNLDGDNGFVLNVVGSGSVANILGSGDFNDDGIDDLMVTTTGSTSNSAVFIIFGQPPSHNWAASAAATSFADGVAGFKIGVSGGGSPKYYYLVTHGDINGDGVDDVVVTGGLSSSFFYVYVVFGQAGWTSAIASFNRDTDLDGSNGFRLTANHNIVSYGFGKSLATGDINNDGYDDILVGQFGSEPAKVYVVFGKPGSWTAPPSSIDDYVVDGTQGFVILSEMIGGVYHTGLGKSVDAADMNADGIDDLVLGAGTGVGSGNDGNRGRVYVVYGREEDEWGDASYTVSDFIDGTQGYQLRGENVYDQAATASVGDVNGDAYPELMITAPKLYAYSNVFIVFGKPGAWPASSYTNDYADGTQGFMMSEGPYTGEITGMFTADMNGDGANEIIITAPSGNGTAGYVYGVLGKTGMVWESTYDLHSYCSPP